MSADVVVCITAQDNSFCKKLDQIWWSESGVADTLYQVNPKIRVHRIILPTMSSPLDHTFWPKGLDFYLGHWYPMILFIPEALWEEARKYPQADVEMKDRVGILNGSFAWGGEGVDYNGVYDITKPAEFGRWLNIHTSMSKAKLINKRLNNALIQVPLPEIYNEPLPEIYNEPLPRTTRTTRKHDLKFDITDKPVIVKFGAGGCRHCKVLDQKWDVISDLFHQLSPGIRIYQIDLSDMTAELDTKVWPKGLSFYTKSWYPMILLIPAKVWNKAVCAMGTDSVVEIKEGVQIMNGRIEGDKPEHNGGRCSFLTTTYDTSKTEEFERWFKSCLELATFKKPAIIGKPDTSVHQVIYGYYSDCSGDYNVLLGPYNKVTGNNCIVFGRGNNVHANNCIVIGNGLTVGVDGTITKGKIGPLISELPKKYHNDFSRYGSDIINTGIANRVIGGLQIIHGNNNYSIGSNTVKGNNNFVLGFNNKITGNNCFIIGNNLVLEGDDLSNAGESLRQSLIKTLEGLIAY
jgi:hypothetical protein